MVQREPESYRASMRSNRALHTLTLLAVLTPCELVGAEAKPPVDDVKKTVAAFAGHWSFHGSVTESGSTASAILTAVMDCKSAVSGTAVACSLSAKVDVSTITAAILIGFNGADGRVYWMEISSTGEYHAHRGRWRGDTIEFEPLVTPAEHGSSTETLQVAFPSKGTLRLKSTTATTDASSTIEATALRRATPAK
jgi:hypothetical protein